MTPGAVVAAVAALAACRGGGRARVDAGRATSPAPRESARYGPPVPREAPPTIPIPEATGGPCRTDADCRGGLCFTPELDAQYSRVFRDCADGRAWRSRRRLYTCLPPGCAVDGDCPRGHRCGDVQMVPFPQRACVPAGCASAADCRARPRGQCVQYVAGAPCEHGGWGCSYESDPCAPRDVDRRCPPAPGMIAYCAPRGGRFRCVYEGAAPP